MKVRTGDLDESRFERRNVVVVTRRLLKIKVELCNGCLGRVSRRRCDTSLGFAMTEK